MFTAYHSKGASDKLNIFAIGLQNCSTVSLNVVGGISSNPSDLLCFQHCILAVRGRRGALGKRLNFDI